MHQLLGIRLQTLQMALIYRLNIVHMERHFVSPRQACLVRVCFLRSAIRLSENRRALLHWNRSRSLTNIYSEIGYHPNMIVSFSLLKRICFSCASKISCVINRSNGREEERDFLNDVPQRFSRVEIIDIVKLRPARAARLMAMM